ncbi:DNA helicase PIF1, ATP-dependent [Tanacetum coccineum]
MSAFTDKETLEGVDPNIVQRLIEMLNQSSSVAKAFRKAKMWRHSHGSVNVQLKLPGERTKGRQYNKPTVAEMAALITNDFGDGVPTRDVIVDSKDSGPKLSELHPSYMALQYPLLFPYGEDGLHEKIPYHTNEGSRKTNRDLYPNVCDAVTRGDTNVKGLKKRIVLAGTFTGGPRYMMSNYQDAMALCRTYGNPDLFITFTSNPKWSEITEMLSYFPGQKPHDRPKVEHCKCNTPAQIDDIISVEIPSQTEDPEGYKVVTEFMLHDPCGKDAKYAPCNIEEKCSKHFPNAFNEETIIDVDGYPIYRRRDNKSSATKGKFKYDNKYVVPHNRYLLLKYQAHINV